uniref:Uncharacterized protein n=1 Tax=Tanacetum cinerariifolium TaxID=118510 RepID=A0A6L2JZR8_TANCI|nr:hypothetical protein [Tanacetum cinerariifolium]
MTLFLMAKAFKLNYSTQTNKNQRISSNPHTKQIAPPGMNLGQDEQMQMVKGNRGISLDSVKNVGNQNGLIVVLEIANSNANQIGNGNVEEAWIQLQAEEFDFMAAVRDLDEIEEVNANCILLCSLKRSSILIYSSLF